MLGEMYVWVASLRIPPISSWLPTEVATRMPGHTVLENDEA